MLHRGKIIAAGSHRFIYKSLVMFSAHSTPSRQICRQRSKGRLDPLEKPALLGVGYIIGRTSQRSCWAGILSYYPDPADQYFGDAIQARSPRRWQEHLEMSPETSAANTFSTSGRGRDRGGYHFTSPISADDLARTKSGLADLRGAATTRKELACRGPIKTFR